MHEPGTLEAFEAEQAARAARRAEPEPPEVPKTTSKAVTNRSASAAPSLETITGKTLMALDLPEPNHVVPGFFVEGLNLLASRPKLGKSWMMLSTAVGVAAGGYALGKVKTERAEVLYCALEDNQRRLQTRLEIITDTAPDGLHLATAGAMPRLYDGGLEQLEAWLATHPACRLVVIDTLARVRPSSRPGADAYEQDAVLGAHLQALALKYRIALVLVHHVRKALAEDFLDTVSGSTGLTGVADAVLVLTRQRGEADAVLHITGRDVEETEHALSFDPERGMWTLLGEASRYALTKERQLILEHLGSQHAPCAPKDVSTATGLSRGSVRNLLGKLLSEGLVRSPERGLYTTPRESGDNADRRQERTSRTAQNPVIVPATGEMTAVTTHAPVTPVTGLPALPMTGGKGVQDAKTKPLSSLSPLLVPVPATPPPEVEELRRRWQTGAYRGQPLKLRGRNYLDLGGALAPYFDGRRLRPAELDDLAEIAAAVGLGPDLFGRLN